MIKEEKFEGELEAEESRSSWLLGLSRREKKRWLKRVLQLF